MTTLNTNINKISLKVDVEPKKNPVTTLKNIETPVNSILPAKAEVLSIKELKNSKIKPINIIDRSVKVATNQTVLSNTKKILNSGAIGVPIDAVFNSFDYEKGKIDSKKYVAKTSNSFVSWSFFEAGSLSAVAVATKIAGKKINPLATMVIGTGLGLVASNAYSKTIGEKVENKLEKYIPENLSKPFADSMAKYVAKPLNKYVVNPIKNNPKTSIAIGLTVATALTLKYPKAFGVNVLISSVGSTAVGMSGSLLLNKALSNSKTNEKSIKIEENKAPTKEELSWALEIEKKFKEDPSKVSDEDGVKYYNILQKFEAQNK